MTKEEVIKHVYSDENLAILNDYWAKEFIKRCHKVRSEAGLKTLNDIELIIDLARKYYIKRKSYNEKKKYLGKSKQQDKINLGVQND